MKLASCTVESWTNYTTYYLNQLNLPPFFLLILTGILIQNFALNRRRRRHFPNWNTFKIETFARRCDLVEGFRKPVWNWFDHKFGSTGWCPMCKFFFLQIMIKHVKYFLELHGSWMEWMLFEQLQSYIKSSVVKVVNSD